MDAEFRNREASRGVQTGVGVKEAMTCDEARERFSELMDGESPAGVEAHVAACAACRRAWEGFHRTVDAVRSLPQHRASGTLLQELRERLQRAEVLRAPEAARRGWAARHAWKGLAAAAVLLVCVWIGGGPTPQAPSRTQASALEKALDLAMVQPPPTTSEPAPSASRALDALDKNRDGLESERASGKDMPEEKTQETSFGNAAPAVIPEAIHEDAGSPEGRLADEKPDTRSSHEAEPAPVSLAWVLNTRDAASDVARVLSALSPMAVLERADVSEVVGGKLGNREGEGQPGAGALRLRVRTSDLAEASRRLSGLGASPVVHAGLLKEAGEPGSGGWDYPTPPKAAEGEEFREGALKDVLRALEETGPEARKKDKEKGVASEGARRLEDDDGRMRGRQKEAQDADKLGMSKRMERTERGVGDAAAKPAAPAAQEMPGAPESSKQEAQRLPEGKGAEEGEGTEWVVITVVLSSAPASADVPAAPAQAP